MGLKVPTLSSHAVVFPVTSSHSVAVYCPPVTTHLIQDFLTTPEIPAVSEALVSGTGDQGVPVSQEIKRVLGDLSGTTTWGQRPDIICLIMSQYHKLRQRKKKERKHLF